MNKKQFYVFALLLLTTLFSHLTHAQVQEFNIELNNINTVIEQEVRDPFSYSGLATFYNGLSAYVVDADGIERLDADRLHTLTLGQSLAIIGHYRILIVSNITAAVLFEEDKLIWQKRDGAASPSFDKNKVQAQLLVKSDLTQLPQPFQKLKYAHLWTPFRILCLGVENILLWLNSIHNLGWGISIILLSLLFKLFILPANIWLTRAQRKVSYIQARLTPDLANIKTNHSGEEAHLKFMNAHKKQGVTPFYTLKPLLLTLTPVPFLIAVFNVLGEVPQIAGHSFLWVKNLAHPDAIYDVGFHIPLLGNTINLLPVLMTLLTVFAALLHQNKIVSPKELSKQKRNLYLMAFGFFLLFYPFPSAMVLYWTFANIWQLIQQRFIRV